MPGILDHITAVVTGDDATRLAKRRSAKQTLAEREVTMGRIRLIDNQMRQQDSRVDAEVEKHRQVCEPAQSRLKQIEDAITVALTDRLPVDPALEAERVELLQTITDANETLERETHAIKKVRAALAKERAELLAGVADITVLRNRLAQEPLANPKLLLSQHCAKQRSQWARNRLLAGQGQLAQWQREVEKIEGRTSEMRMNNYGNRVSRKLDAADTEQLRIMQARVARWSAEVDAAGAECAAANQEGQRIYDDLINE